jgi:hypothetical protein
LEIRLLAASNIVSARKPNFRSNVSKRSIGRARSSQLRENGCFDTPATFDVKRHIAVGHRLGSTMRPWNTARATIYGAAIGVAAAAVKLFAPWSEPQDGSVIIKEFFGAALAFALLCGVAAALRNFVARRLVWRKLQ